LSGGKKMVLILLLLASHGSSLWLISQVPRENYLLTFTLFLIAFGSTLGIYKCWEKHFSWQKLLLLGVLLRACVFFYEPNWSEDGLRFLWDGNLIKEGQNPYLFSPEEWKNQVSGSENSFWEHAYPQLNSALYYSVYPPVKQVFFWLGAQVTHHEVYLGFLALRGILLVGELGTFWLLWTLLGRFQRPKKLILLYWLNPLVILETIGNLHFEGLVLFFLLLAIWGFDAGKHALAGLGWGMAVAVKLLPLLLAPLLLSWKGTKRDPIFWGVTFLVLVASFVPLILNESWKYFYQSLQLYQGRFEFNASLYYLARALGYWVAGYNTIAILTKAGLGIVFLGSIFLAWKQSSTPVCNLPKVWAMLYLVYFLIQPVVHPWYLLPALGLSVLAGQWTFVLWSFAAIFSYQAYSENPVQEKPIFLILEYILVMLGIYLDYFRKQRTFTLVQ